jgi:hypothetical protein
MIEDDIKRIAYSLGQIVELLQKERVLPPETEYEQKVEESFVNSEATQKKTVKRAMERKAEKAEEKVREKVELINDLAKKSEAVAEEQDNFEPEKVTREQVRQALMTAAGVIGQKEARELLQEVGGADTLGGIDERDYGRVFRAALEAAGIQESYHLKAR